jgi:hypothetical protein
MGQKILSATYGDDKSNTDVTAAVADRITGAGEVKIPVNSSIVSFFTLAETATLNDTELKQAKDRAADACGGPQDQICVAKKTEEMKSKMLDEKRAASNRVDNIVRGNRLEVTVQDGAKIRKIAVPEGQTLTEEILSGKPPKGGAAPIDVKAATNPPLFSFGNFTGALTSLGVWLGGFVGVILYVLGILVPWKVFGDEGYVTPKYVATAASVFIPGSGLVITPLFFGLRAFAERLKPALDAAAAQKQSL